jgi:hypothetical protein
VISGESFFSGRLKRLAWWAALALFAVWLALVVNAWRYFAGAGIYGLYPSLIHAVDVLRLPTPDEPGDLGDKRRLDHNELLALTQKKSISIPRGDRPDQIEVYLFDNPTIAQYSPAFSIGSTIDRVHYIIDRDRICDLSFLESYCYRYYTDADGNIFRYFPKDGPVPSRWRRVTLTELG